VVAIVGSGSPLTSAAASHLIYIAAFANERNHQSFIRAGAVQALADVIVKSTTTKTPPPLAVQSMWAMAALQNLEASYCDTEDNGRCYWAWHAGDGDHHNDDDETNGHELMIGEGSLPLLSDGSSARRAAMEIPNLVAALKHHVCRAPIGEEDEIFPGENALAGRDDDNMSIVAWAAAAALKNMALEKKARAMIKADSSFECYCRFKDSHDWLEELKGNDLLLFLRPFDPCWFDDDYTSLCVDGWFLDEEGYYCDDYGSVEEEEDCEAKDVFTGLPATELCCGCGGGVRYGDTRDEL